MTVDVSAVYESVKHHCGKQITKQNQQVENLQYIMYVGTFETLDEL